MRHYPRTCFNLSTYNAGPSDMQETCDTELTEAIASKVRLRGDEKLQL